ncbi:N-acetylmuramoyl-L-alanine amidase [Streptomyces sp. PKU-EA00015]|uniref:peptidoglycan-binding protein n=1 Tax=Streptomyces sp. PKU-EA00015 TaxID=2748326 RepID=UPI0015A049C9|nr:peptidoglycan-binding protein [Streptomyces sp. PKU-EA00015]NWF25878.1 N-acetylmuramoyl-L-alanine amidase [Streptomyces sp. PKU-EA00015]
MATPLSADRLLKALRNEGLRVVEHRSWRTHNRNHKGPWGPVNGVMIHHTVTKGTESSVELCYNGHSSLPGPLCHGVIAKDGTVYLVGNGRANHAGLGDDDVLRAVVNESASLPADNEANTDGNRHFYGFECINLGDGKDPWPAAQLEAVEKAAAAICRAHGWSHRSVIGHKEWQPGKVDPRGFTMDSMRSRIRERLGGAPDGPATPPPAPRYEPFPGAAFFQAGRRSPVITAMGKRLVAEGCGRYEVGPGPEWTEADRASYAAWQRKLGYSGSDADGIPGRTSWDKLKVPNV